MEETFLIIDGSSLIHRAFFALPPLTSPTGVPTGAVYGLCNMLLKLLQELKPAYMAVAFDKSRKTFRTEKFEAYKGQRKATPPELKEQFPLSIRLLTAMGIPTLEVDNYEADDIIGTLAASAPKDVQVKIVTGDRDEFQLISDNVQVYFTKKGISNLGIYDEAAFKAEYQGLVPRQIIELKGLMGDTSDNIPGVPGVGPKTALKLVTEYQTVENVLDHAADVKGKSLQEKLKTYRDQALLSKDLATICLDVPEISRDPKAYALTGMTAESRKLMQELQFKNLWNRFLPVLGSQEGDAAAEAAGTQVEAAAPALPQVEITTQAEAQDLLQQIRQAGEELALTYALSGDLPHRTLEQLNLVLGDKEYVWKVTDSSKAAALELLADPVVKKAIPNPKKLYKYMLEQGSHLLGVADDPELAAYLYEPGENSYELTRLAETFLPHGHGGTAQDAAALVPLLRGFLEDRNQTQLYQDIELPLTENLALMEYRGIAIDEAMLEEVTKEMTGRVAALEQQAWNQAGEEFNVNSTKQLGVILFEKLGLPIIKKTKTGYSTDVSVLEALQGEHPLIETLIEYRQLSKLLSTYLLGLHPLINPVTGRIHTHFNQMATVTGRLSSTEPNLQNIPTRTEVGKRMRAMFVPGKGYDLLLSCDYSQVELRVMASIAGDELLLDSFRHGQDVHARTASEVFGVPLEEVTPYMRSKAKTVNFGIIYGISDFGLAKQLGVSRAEAAQYIDSYFARYTGVKEYMEREKQKARDLGYVETLFGRRRYLPDIHASNFNKRSFAERTAINTPIQGTAADIIKIAMLQVEKKLQEAGVKSRVLLQVHDELVLEVTQDEAEQVGKLVKETMEQAVKLQVPLVADVATGTNWALAK